MENDFEEFMATRNGVLRELGQSSTANNGLVKYSYIEIGDEMIKPIYTYRGLDGKIRIELGNPVTLHVYKATIVAITTQDGKTYCSEKPKTTWYASAFVLLAIGILPIVILGYIFAGYGLLFGAVLGFIPLLIGCKILGGLSVMASGSGLPNAIEIPR